MSASKENEVELTADKSQRVSQLRPGIYVPTVAFFTPDSKIDEAITANHAVRLAKAGVTGLVTHGSNGEAVHLDHAERALITRATRNALDSAGYSYLPVIHPNHTAIFTHSAETIRGAPSLASLPACSQHPALPSTCATTGPSSLNPHASAAIFGCTQGLEPVSLLNRVPLSITIDKDFSNTAHTAPQPSTRETIQLCQEAAQAGGTHALILPPAYYGSLLSTTHIMAHFRDVADQSPLPIVIYNFPAACGGLDLSSDTILALSQHPNICGVKLTCGNTGKLACIVTGTTETDFLTFGGSADFLVQTLAVGGHGVIAGLANLAPKACVQLMALWQEGRHENARHLQGTLAKGDWTAIQGGFVSVKVGLQKYHGYGGHPRKPCTLPDSETVADQEEGFRELMEVEHELSS